MGSVNQQTRIKFFSSFICCRFGHPGASETILIQNIMGSENNAWTWYSVVDGALENRAACRAVMTRPHLSLDRESQKQSRRIGILVGDFRWQLKTT